MIFYIEKLSEKFGKYSLFFDSAVVIFASLLIGLFSQFELIIPFSPVPLTLQTFAVLLCGLILGKTRGAISVILYLIEGASGLPFFAGGGFGVRYIFGPSGGYLLGFICAAYLSGLFAELNFTKNYFKTLIALIISNFSIYIFGLFYLSIFVGSKLVFELGLYPFLVSDLIKIVFLSLSFPFISKVLKAREKFY